MPQNIFSEALRVIYQTRVDMDKLAVGNDITKALNWKSQLIANRKLDFPLVASWTCGNKSTNVKLSAGWTPYRNSEGYNGEQVEGAKHDASTWWNMAAAYEFSLPDKELLAVIAYWVITSQTGMANSYEGCGKIHLTDIAFSIVKPVKFSLITTIRANPVEKVEYTLENIKGLIAGNKPMYNRFANNLMAGANAGKSKTLFTRKPVAKPVATKKARAKKVASENPPSEVTV